MFCRSLRLLLMHALNLNCESREKGKGNWPSQVAFSLVFTVPSNHQTRQDRMDRSSASEVSQNLSSKRSVPKGWKGHRRETIRRSVMHKSDRNLCTDKRNTFSSGTYDWLDAHLWMKKRKEKENNLCIPFFQKKMFEQFPDGILQKQPPPHSHRVTEIWKDSVCVF